jgi:hypothetical protein
MYFSSLQRVLHALPVNIMKRLIIRFCPVPETSLDRILTGDQVWHENKENVPQNTSKPRAMNGISKHGHSVSLGTSCPSPKQQDHSLSIVREYTATLLYLDRSLCPERAAIVRDSPPPLTFNLYQYIQQTLCRNEKRKEK